MLSQLCAALDHAHAQGMVHRDIKPDNVLVAQDGTVKLLDFGLARILDEGFGEQSVLAGTPYYMAPEQLSGGVVDHRADIYALGVVLFRMLAGVLPFTEGNVFVAHAIEPVPDLRTFDATLPADAIAVVERCLAKKADDRFDTCAPVAAAIERAFGSDAVSPPS
jgi:serine/threonine-protein kinase